MIVTVWGVIDIGSNTIRLVAYDLEKGIIQSLLNKKYAAGLIGYVGKDHRLSEAGIRLLVEILGELTRLSARIGLAELFAFATASLRNISNTQEVLGIIQQSCGLPIRLLSGEEEATLDYYGAARSVRLEEGLLVDVGGGSTELVFYRDAKPLIAKSLPVGSLNLFQQHVSGILPKKKEMRSIRRDIIERLKNMNLAKPFSVDTICGVGGSARSAQILINDLRGLPKETMRYPCIALKDIPAMLEEDPFSLSRRILRVAPERIHTLLPGVAIVQAVIDFYDPRQMLTSRYGVREGYLLRILEERGVWRDS